LGVIRVEAMASKFAKLAVTGKATMGANEIAAVAGALASKELEVASWEVYKKALQRAEHERTTAHRLATMIEALSSSSSSSASTASATSGGGSGGKPGGGGSGGKVSGDGAALPPPLLPRGFRSAPIDTPLATSKLSCLAPGGGVEEGADPASTASDRLFFEHCKSKCPRDKLPNLIRKHVFAICRVPRGSLWVPPAFLPPPTPTLPTQFHNGSRSVNSSSNSISDLDTSSTATTNSRTKTGGEEGGGAGVTRRPQLAIPNGAGGGGGGGGGSGGSLSPTPLTTPFITLPSTGGGGRG
jgi:hypothetical protein